jgi:RNA polymerase sigma factor FliA
MNRRAPGRAPSAFQRDHLVFAHIDLVRRIAWAVRRRTGSRIDQHDLVQAGLVALVEAAGRYEDLGFTFATYATTRIRGAMIDHVRQQSAEPRSALLFRKAADQARDRLDSVLGRTPTDHEMASALGLSPETYRHRLFHSIEIRCDSLADVYSDCVAAFALKEDAIEDRLGRTDMAAAVNDALRRLPSREARVLQLYFVEEQSLQDIGSALGVGAARVCQIKKSALARMRDLLAASRRDA